MNKAVRFSNASKLAKDLNAYYASVIFDAEYEQEKAMEDFWAEEEYDYEYGKYSRVALLQETEGKSLLEAVDQVAQEEAEWKASTYAWLQDPKNFDSELYSDIFKDYYGYRPHGYRPMAIA